MDEITKADAFALAELFDASFPLKEWLLGAAKRSESRRRCSDSNLYLQERNLWLLAAKLAGSELLGDGTHAESVGRNSEENCGNVRSETSRRWQCVLSWLEATAEENVEYFEHSTHRSAVNIDSDCVEGVVSRALALTPDTCLTAVRTPVLQCICQSVRFPCRRACRCAQRPRTSVRVSGRCKFTVSSSAKML